MKDAAHYKRHREMLRDMMRSAPVGTGVCCCGDDMQRHSNPMDCGHSPRDQWDWSVECIEKRIEQEDAQTPPTQRVQVGILFRLASFWVGAHWSPYNRRWCINLLPCVTIWIALPGGKTP